MSVVNGETLLARVWEGWGDWPDVVDQHPQPLPDAGKQRFSIHELAEVSVRADLARKCTSS
ncbi:MAG TPA: hypothetical protein VGM01_10845 [Ktedonobacteraceae bacterium]